MSMGVWLVVCFLLMLYEFICLLSAGEVGVAVIFFLVGVVVG